MRPDDSQTRFELVPFFHGRILDISEGSSRAYPHFISHLDCRIDDPTKLSIFADKSLDGVLSSHVIHLMGEDERKEAVKEWSRVVRDGGHIMLHLPKDHEKALWDVSYDSIVSLMDSVPRSWDMVKHLERGDFLSVFRMQ